MDRREFILGAAAVSAAALIPGTPARAAVDRYIDLRADLSSINIRAAHDAIFPNDLASGDTVTLVIHEGVTVGPNLGGAVVDVGEWPPSVQINIVNNGTIAFRPDAQ